MSKGRRRERYEEEKEQEEEEEGIKDEEWEMLGVISLSYSLAPWKSTYVDLKAFQEFTMLGKDIRNREEDRDRKREVEREI